MARKWLRRPKSIDQRPGWPDDDSTRESPEWVRSRYAGNGGPAPRAIRWKVLERTPDESAE
jgi:hypothetical protein